MKTILTVYPKANEQNFSKTHKCHSNDDRLFKWKSEKRANWNIKVEKKKKPPFNISLFLEHL